MVDLASLVGVILVCWAQAGSSGSGFAQSMLVVVGMGLPVAEYRDSLWAGIMLSIWLCTHNSDTLHHPALRCSLLPPTQCLCWEQQQRIWLRWKGWNWHRWEHAGSSGSVFADWVWTDFAGSGESAITSMGWLGFPHRSGFAYADMKLIWSGFAESS